MFAEPKKEEPKEAAKSAETASQAATPAETAAAEGQSSSAIESYDGPPITSLDIRVGKSFSFD